MQSDASTFDPVPLLSEELSLNTHGVSAVVKLLEEGNTVPFIARYRKEATGNLDEVQIRDIKERHAYLLELEDRRQTILASIEEQGKLTDELRGRILACQVKSTLEDLYLPYKPKRRTKATIARERGLAPLALRILEQPTDGDPESEAEAYIDKEKGVDSTIMALMGARHIVAESIAEDADIRAYVRDTFLKTGRLKVEADEEKSKQPTKFEQYYDYEESVAEIPSHRFLAIQRGEREGVLRAHIEVDVDSILHRVHSMMKLNSSSPFSEQMILAAKDAYKRLLASSVETDVRVELKLRSDRTAVDVFANNLRNLLLAAPLGERGVIGIDPGLRTGCKCVALDHTGKFLENTTIYIHSQGNLVAAKRDILAFVKKYSPFAVAIGNGTGGRETESFVKKALSGEGIRDVVVVQVNEAGASVYSASDVAREEFPDLDLTIRGAISIARRLQDPLAELVKIDPKAIGVGQYQHDVFQPLLQRKLDEVVESCVNHVGVELNTASAPLLSYVAGIGKSAAKKIVKHRETKGAFTSRKELLKVAGVGPRTFEQAAGFLRLRGSKHPLDGSAVHPERYELVEQMAKDLDVSLTELIGNEAVVRKINVKQYISEEVGEPTLKDIIDELKKPGRDPRASFEPPKFREDVQEMDDLRVGMWLEGVVTNVTNFGAFVDVGVHQDGLVHISQLADRFVKDPHEVVAVGQKINVCVLEVDLVRRRIALSARSDAQPSASSSSQSGGGDRRGQQARGPARRNQGNKRSQGNNKSSNSFSNNPFANLLKK
ncbi:MAG: RNA-binding transcriptional accessory protein [Deltaproteobacteria bacterium]|nr:RNA-binding transcriptional accessory protein [Deltaproteobacteria bacterium]